MTLAELMQIWAGPQLMPLPKAQSNVTAGSPPGVPYVHPYQLMAPFTALNSATYENKLREAQAQEAMAKAALAKSAGEPAPSMFGADNASPGAAAAPTGGPASAYGSLAPSVPSSGGGRLSDPRGVADLIRQSAVRYGHDPDVAIKVAQSEGLGAFYGDGGKSGTAFQLYTGGGLGNEFQKETGLSPLDPKNEPAAIDWAMKNLDRTGWSPYHGAKKVGVGSRDGIGIGAPGNLPAVPNFAGMMAGNQGAAYAPPAFGSLGGGGGVRPVTEGTEEQRAAFFARNQANPSSTVSWEQFSAPPSGGSPAAPSAFGSPAPTMQPAQAGPQAMPQAVGPSAAPGAPPQGTGLRPFNPAYLAWAQQQDRVNAALGRRNPVAVEEALKMAPGMSMSPSYLAAAEEAKARGRVGPAYAMPDANAALQGQLAEAKARAEAAAAWGKPEASPELQGQIAGSRKGAESPIEMAQRLFQAQLDTIGQANRTIELGPDREADVNPYRFPFPAVPAPAPVVSAVPGGAAASPGAQSAVVSGAPSPAGVKLKGPDSASIEFGQKLASKNSEDFFVRRKAAQDAATSLVGASETRKLLDSGMITGIGADFRLSFAKAMSLVGANDGETVANTEAFSAAMAKDVMSMIGALGSGVAISNADLKFTQDAAGGKTTLDEKSIRRIIDLNERFSRRVIEKFNKDAEKVDLKLSPYPLTVDVPAVAARGQPIDEGTAAAARDAIAKGAPRDAVLEKLRRGGFNPGDL